MDIYGDESGNFDFDPKTGSRHFFVATMATSDTHLAADLLALRRELLIRGFDLRHDGFHATEDRQAVRDEVFAFLAGRQVQVDCTYYLKANVYGRIWQNVDYFYKWAWYNHLRHLLPRLTPPGEAPFIAIATLGNKRKRAAYHDALRDVVQQSSGQVRPTVAHWTAASHPCLQAADYYTWALARSIEGHDRRSHELIQHQVSTLYRYV